MRSGMRPKKRRGMRHTPMQYLAAMSMVAACAIAAIAQDQAPGPASAPANASASAAADASQAGGTLHGVVKSGNIPLPGVAVTAQNTLTGKRYTTTTDITGAWSMTIPQNGRYVIRTQFAAFAAGSQEALLNATGHDRTVNFALILASRAGSANSSMATGEELTAIAAAVIGGTSILGGEGAIWRGVVGALLLTLIGNGFNLLGWNTTYEQVVTGCLILFAVAVDRWLRKRSG